MNKKIDPVSALFAVLFAAVLLSFAFGCRDIDPPPNMEARLQGAWKHKIFSITNTYNFHTGSVDACAMVPAQPVQCWDYFYTCSGDTLTMTCLADPTDTNRAVVKFSEDGDTATLGWIGGVEYHLIRL